MSAPEEKGGERSLSLICQALVEAARELATPHRGPTVREMARHAGIDPVTARYPARHLTKIGALVVIRTRSVPYLPRGQSVAEYAASTNAYAEQAAAQDVQQSVPVPAAAQAKAMAAAVVRLRHRSTPIEPLFLARAEVASFMAMSVSSIEQAVREGTFPRPRRLSHRRVGWLVRELREWVESRPVADLLPPRGVHAYSAPRKP